MNSNSPLVPTENSAPKRTLTLIDSICIIVGTIIGAGIFRTSPLIASFSGSLSMLILVWLIGGLVALVGAACFAELTTTHPNAVGGDYVYLKRAFGRPFGFMFAWASFWAIRPGNIGAMAMVFASYFSQIVPVSESLLVLYAVAAVVLLSLTNLIGIRQGKTAQNVLTFAKVAGIGAIVLLAFLYPYDASDVALADVSADSADGDAEGGAPPNAFWLAIVFVMFSYGGWNDISLVAGEVKKPRRNLFRSLFLGILTVMSVYLIFNIALVYGLGFDAMSSSQAVATDLVAQALGVDNLFGQRSGQLIAGLVCISCLGAINGMILTSPRIYYAAGQDYSRLKFLSHWNEQRDCPWQAILLQTAVTIGLILICSMYVDTFEVLVVSTAPYFWSFLALSVISLIVLRYKSNPDSEVQNVKVKNEVESFRVKLFPMEPIFFAGVCLALVVKSVLYIVEKNYLLPSICVGVLMLLGIGLSLTLSGSGQKSTD